MSEVLDWLQKIDVDSITMKMLTLKTVMLLTLLPGQRVQTLRALSVNKLKLTESSAEFHIETLLKQSKPGRHLSVINFTSYNDRQLCVVSHLKHKYINMTKDLRKTNALFISYQSKTVWSNYN